MFSLLLKELIFYFYSTYGYTWDLIEIEEYLRPRNIPLVNYQARSQTFERVGADFRSLFYTDGANL